MRNLEIHTCIDATVEFMRRAGLTRPMLMVEDGTRVNFEHFETENDSPDSIVIGLAPSHFHYERLNRAYRLLTDKKVISKKS